MKAKCDNCGLLVVRCKADLANIPQLFERIEPGNEVPAGECPSCGCLCYVVKKTPKQPKSGSIKLYYHKTDGGAEYLTNTYIKCQNGHKEGTFTNKTKYVVRLDGDITKDAELTIK